VADLQSALFSDSSTSPQRFTGTLSPAPTKISKELRHAGEDRHSGTELGLVHVAVGDQEKERVERQVAGDLQAQARCHVDERAPGREHALAQVVVAVLMEELRLQGGGKALREASRCSLSAPARRLVAGTEDHSCLTARAQAQMPSPFLAPKAARLSEPRPAQWKGSTAALSPAAFAALEAATEVAYPSLFLFSPW
jgi:hypothetical protein